MADAVSFDDILGLASRKGPFEVTVKAWDKTVYVRDPSSADVDAWRVYCSANHGKPAAFSAKVVQLLLCDADGVRLVPQTDEALAKLADGDPAGIDELAAFCVDLMREPTPQEVDDEKKD